MTNYFNKHLDGDEETFRNPEDSDNLYRDNVKIMPDDIRVETNIEDEEEKPIPEIFPSEEQLPFDEEIPHDPYEERFPGKPKRDDFPGERIPKKLNFHNFMNVNCLTKLEL